MQYTDSNNVAQEGAVALTENDIYKISGTYNANVFVTEDRTQFPLLRPLPVAGFVNLADVDATLFNLNNYALKKENNHRYYIQAIFNQGVKVDLTKYMHVDKRTSSTKEYKNRFVDILSNEIIETFKNVKE